jgi:hypothetical protein
MSQEYDCRVRETYAFIIKTARSYDRRSVANLLKIYRDIEDVARLLDSPSPVLGKKPIELCLEGKVKEFAKFVDGINEGYV